MFDNEFVSLVQMPGGKTCVVFTSVIRNDLHSDAVLKFNIPSKFMSGIAHFSEQPTLDEI